MNSKANILRGGLVGILALSIGGCSGGPDDEALDVETATEALHSATAAKDFNRDGRTDILWHNPGNGTVNVWMLSNFSIIGNPDVNMSVRGSTGWQARGTGDFNRDGKTDILWWEPGSGKVNTWLLDGTRVITNPDISFGVSASTGWDLVGTGDFDGDNNTDILWYHAATGRLNTWLLRGGTTVWNNPDIATRLGGRLQVKGTGDFNNDGSSDVVVFDPVAQSVKVLLLRGINPLSASPIVPITSSGIQLSIAGMDLRGTGDYNRDGKTDLIWWNRATGVITVWILDGTRVTAVQNLSQTVAGSTGWDMVTR